MPTATLDAARPRTAGRSIRRAAFYILAALLVLLAAGALRAWWRIRAALPQLDGTLEAPGLAAPVDVLRDARGVPHIRAASIEDAFFAQGYVTAQDRLWQMDLSRRLARGELAEIFGSRALAIDTEHRRLGFRAAAERAAQELPPDVARLLAAYARGVNAFIASHLDRLPIEFVLLGYQPRPWREADSISVELNMMEMLNSSWTGDLLREGLRARLGGELYADLFPQDSPLEHPVAEMVPGPPHAAPPSSAALQAPAAAPGPGAARGLDATLDALLADPDDDALALGSNNWVVSGAHTATGKPLLSNDPHIGHSLPSVWYLVHLKAPGLDVAGSSLPGGPSVVIGHNERIAWGMTNTGPDVQDLYVETFNEANPRQYRFEGRWVDAEMREETIKVRGGGDVHLTVPVTRHGPIVSNDGGRALALCWTALEPHALTFPLLGMDAAQNWTEFLAALRTFTGPEQNMVFADVDGNIGYYAPAWVPVRRQGDGTVPVPGDTAAYEWAGYVPFEDLPHAYNPAGGIIATANSRVVPSGYPYFFTDLWAPPFRTARIFSLLQAGTPGRSCGAGKAACFTVDDMLKIDMDIHPLDDAWLRQALLRAASARPPARDDARQALELLRNWDGEAHADSPVPLICHEVRIALRERLLEPKLGKDLARHNWSLSELFVEKAVDQQLARWLPPGDADFSATLLAALDAGLDRVEQRQHGRNVASWRWGDTIPLTFHHPLDAIPIAGRFFDVGPFPQAGTADTVKATTPGAGPSMRMVVDFADFDHSVQNLTLGQSGEITSPYYSDQFQAWYTGRSFPMLFSDQAVEQGAAHRLRLTPAARP